MARIRTIKPEFWEDETVGKLSRDARLLFIACFNLADDKGRLRWSPAYVRSSAFMFDDDLTLADVEKLMTELTDLNLVRAYTAGKGGQWLAVVVNFLKHQVINRPSPSQLPPPPSDDPEALFDADFFNFPEDSLSTHGGLTEGREGKGKEGKGREGKGKRPATTLPANFTVTENLVAWAATKTPTIDIKAETEKFQNYAKAHDKRYSDWDAAWRNWMLKAVEYKTPAPATSGPATTRGTWGW